MLGASPQRCIVDEYLFAWNSLTARAALLPAIMNIYDILVSSQSPLLVPLSLRTVGVLAGPIMGSACFPVGAGALPSLEM